MKDSIFDWDDNYSDDLYNREKYAHRNMSVVDNHDELRNITYQIRKDLQCKRINVYVNQDMQIILSSNLKEVETMPTVMEVFEELNRLEKTYLSDFDICNFEMVMEDDKPTIYCSYERI